MLPNKKIQILLNGKADKLFKNSQYPVPFEFNQDVVEVFDDMVSRSVPMYQEVNKAIVQWSYLFHQEKTCIYDIGCSTGTTLHAIAEHLPHSANLVGIDSSLPMVIQAKKKLKQVSNKHMVEILHSDALETKVSNTSFTVMNYTLQFIPLRDRSQVLKKIFSGTVNGGVLFISEKVRSEDPFFQDALTRIYEDFKINAGYSPTEVERKKEALDRVLVPQTLDELMTMLYKAGFTSVEPILRWNTFVSIVAKKN